MSGGSAELAVVSGGASKIHVRRNRGLLASSLIDVMVCMNDDVLEGFEGKNYDPGELFAEWSASLVA